MMFSFTVIKEPCPAWLSFPALLAEHIPSVYTGLHTLPLILLAESRDAVWPGSSVGPFPNLVLLSACPWKHCDILLAHWGRDKGGPIVEEMKHVYLPRCYTHTDEQGQTNRDPAWWTLLKPDIHSVWDSCLVDPNQQGAVLSSLSPPFPSTPKYSSYQSRHFFLGGAIHLWSYFLASDGTGSLPAVKTLSL